MTLKEILTTVSKKPKKENPTNSPKVPPSSATLKSRYTLVTGPDYQMFMIKLTSDERG